MLQRIVHRDGVRDVTLSPDALGAILNLASVIPVLTLEEGCDDIGIADALVAGGLSVIEVTLRTPYGLSALRRMAAVPGSVVGAGSVLTAAHVEAAAGAGAAFLVSPGLSQPVVDAAVACGLPLLPGIATAGEIMRGLNLGLTHFKFFPAEAAGGLPMLRALAAPFAEARFCPTGGISRDTAPAWLAEPSVVCVGGSWMVRAGDCLQSIRSAARAAAALRSASSGVK